MTVRWLADVRADDIESVGGKGASLGELTAGGLPIPPGFAVTGGTYRAFLEETGIASELFEAVAVDPEDSKALAAAHDRAEELLTSVEVPAAVREEILGAYDTLDGEEPFVAVRSSATAEDLPDASFAGQQETFLNVTGEDLIERVRECWVSLFTERAISYREQQGFAHEEVDIAVVVQRMVDAEKSGVLFTSHPSTGARESVIEAAWGLGEAVVAGEVSPDNYVIDRTSREPESVTIAEKRTMYVKGENGDTVSRSVPEDKREARVLDDGELDRLVELGERVEDHYGEPQDVEWAINDGEVFMLQSRPITTIEPEENADAVSQDDEPTPATSADRDPTETNLADGSGVATSDNEEVLFTGLGASPGTASGPARIVEGLDQLDRVQKGDVIVTEMTTPDMVPAMQRASAIVTDEGGMTSHASIISRELGVPAVVGSANATEELSTGRAITVNGDTGTVSGGQTAEDDRESLEEVRPQAPVKPMTATEVKVNISIPEAAERAAATGADGVGLLRLEHMVLSTDKTPEKYIADHGVDAYVGEIVDGVRALAEEFYPRPVRVRTLDAPTDEFRQLEGGEDEPLEHNPMLGYRGIRRSLDRPDVFEHELRAFEELYGMGYDNVEIMFPLVNDAEDVLGARNALESVGIDPERRSWGVMIETPASALSVESMAEVGIDFVSFGTNDLTQYTLAVDRNNEAVADRFDELHPAVVELIESTIETCRERGVETSICGQAGSKPVMVQQLVNAGISSISANIDAIRNVQHEVKRVEQKIVLDEMR